jgi:hypothetical protein
LTLTEILNPPLRVDREPRVVSHRTEKACSLFFGIASRTPCQCSSRSRNIETEPETLTHAYLRWLKNFFLGATTKLSKINRSADQDQHCSNETGRALGEPARAIALKDTASASDSTQPGFGSISASPFPSTSAKPNSMQHLWAANLIYVRLAAEIHAGA